ncbi:Nuclear polyadenylated RNA-binding protein NAB2 [Colletotrichum tanaceti]|uniref:Nuclear polyadenylated RNA-binding protein NAB2 n=1 Tax=Colletotrichum tanaceti TaxID=1306861 RepID=A0A4U6XJ18_9PEZI|nr:Nuclear polyadenylated RNA-binding protein NAB2 [Colletotrichum tanaceti]
MPTLGTSDSRDSPWYRYPIRDTFMGLPLNSPSSPRTFSGSRICVHSLPSSYTTFSCCLCRPAITYLPQRSLAYYIPRRKRHNTIARFFASTPSTALPGAVTADFYHRLATRLAFQLSPKHTEPRFAFTPKLDATLAVTAPIIMTVQVVLNTPLADALSAAIQPKLVEAGWASGSEDDAALVEYIILMLVNGRTQEQIATELSADLLSLGPEDPGAMEFAAWLFQQAEQINAQLNGSQPAGNDAVSQGNGDFDTDMGANDGNELNASVSLLATAAHHLLTHHSPTGPRSMRNGPNPRGTAREKRMLGHMTKAMDRSGDSVLHRVRGNDRINSHARGPPTGPRGGIGRGGRSMNSRGVNIQAGLNAMTGMNGQHGAPPGMNPMAAAWGMPPQGQPSQMDLMAMMEQQAQMMSQLQQQLMNQSGGRGGRRGGKSLFDRTQNPRGGFGNRQQHPRDKQDSVMGEGAEGDDVEMSQSKREPPNPDETICKYNLHCTNRECKFAHQSPAAPPGTTVDIGDVCTFGAACKNRKCVGRHPSPAARLAHQSEQDCKFFPNCTNPRCPFKHPEMPLCRNGAGCTTSGCKFTHVKVKCRFNPCKNPHCMYTHEEGQQGVFKDKVWTADGSNDHVSERQFVDSNAPAEVILPESENAPNQEHGNAQEVIS